MKKSKSNIWLKTLFSIYIILLIWIILFRLNFSISSIHRIREINLIPFYYENVYEGDIPIFEAILNVLIFLPFVAIIYYVIPHKARYLWLLACSYYFYMCWNARYALLIALSTLITYASGLLIHRSG